MSRAAMLTRHAGLADAVGDFERGRTHAQRFLDELRAGTADGDALFYELRKAQTTPAHERGFVRALQRALERGVGDGE